MASPSSSGFPSTTSVAVTPPPNAADAGPFKSFTEAFSFVKKTEFYSPPPPIIPPAIVGSASAVTGAATIRGQAAEQRLRYHLLHPDYLYYRIRELPKGFRLRVILCFVDVEDVIKPLHEVTKTALVHECTLLCAWSLHECARYLETIKIYENKPADTIQERTDHDYLSRLTGVLTTVRHVNRTDVMTLGSSFGTLSAIIGGSMEELARCPGIGEKKVRRLYDAFHEPFRRTSRQLRLSNFGVKLIVPNENIAKENQQIEVANGDALQNVADALLEGSVKKSMDVLHTKHGYQVSTCNKRIDCESKGIDENVHKMNMHL
eukprot:c24077_g1_i3 orf=69-1025(-)